MKLTDTELRYYDSNVLRLPDDKRKEYHAQVDRLISELNKKIREKTKIKVTKVIKSGSFAKHTILRRTSDDPVDVDVVFYISGRSVDHETLQTLSDTIYDLLTEIYPSKAVEDFKIQRKAATVTFVGTGLTVDIVPIIEDPANPDHGWQFDRDGTKNRTCAPCQIDFVRKTKNADGAYRTLVRMAKRWRNYAELDHFKSFAVELIMAHSISKNPTNDSIERKFRDFLLYIARSGLKEPITFDGAKVPASSAGDIVVIIDPANSENNIASRLSETERQEIVAVANNAWETANFALTEATNEAWKEIFGPRFKTEE